MSLPVKVPSSHSAYPLRCIMIPSRRRSRGCLMFFYRYSTRVVLVCGTFQRYKNGSYRRCLPRADDSCSALLYVSNACESDTRTGEAENQGTVVPRYAAVLYYRETIGPLAGVEVCSSIIDSGSGRTSVRKRDAGYNDGEMLVSGEIHLT